MRIRSDSGDQPGVPFTMQLTKRLIKVYVAHYGNVHVRFLILALKSRVSISAKSET